MSDRLVESPPDPVVTSLGFAGSPELRKGLRAPFPAEQIGTLPRPTKKNAEKGNCRECGKYHGLPAIHLSYVGHAAVCDRLNQVEPSWTYTIDRVIETDDGHVRAIVGTMTIGGKSLPETGDAEPTEYSTYADEMKKAISDFIRRGAMRFGVAIDLWSKEDLAQTSPDAPTRSRQGSNGDVADPSPSSTGAEAGDGPPSPSAHEASASEDQHTKPEAHYGVWVPIREGSDILRCDVEGCGETKRVERVGA